MNRASLLVASLALAFAGVTGCGRQGDLYLPGPARDIVTRPVQSPEPGGTPETSNSPQSVDSPETPASPAPEVTAPEVPSPESPEDNAKKNGAPPPKK
jgi:predicted small lipoprotein YifL